MTDRITSAKHRQAAPTAAERAERHAQRIDLVTAARAHVARTAAKTPLERTKRAAERLVQLSRIRSLGGDPTEN
jgi:hypothetical protein